MPKNRLGAEEGRVEPILDSIRLDEASAERIVDQLGAASERAERDGATSTQGDGGSSLHVPNGEATPAIVVLTSQRPSAYSS